MINIIVIRKDEMKPSHYEVVANVGSKQIGSIKLEVRSDILAAGHYVKAGIISKIVVDKDYRMQGVSQQMLKVSMTKFSKEKVDIAITQTDIEKLSKLYKRVGFVKLNSSNMMVASVGNKKIYDLIIKDDIDIMIDPRALRKSLYHPE